MRAVLRVRDLRLVFGALTLSTIGSWAYNIALLTFVFERTGSLAWVGAAGLVRFVPALVASAYAGVLAERFERIGLLQRCDLIAGVAQLGLLVVALSGAPVVVALVLSAVTAVVTAPYEPAVAAVIPELAGEDELAAANALRGLIDNLVVVVGPALGAAVIALGSTELVFGLNAATFFVSAVIVGRLRMRSTPSDVTEGGTAGPLRQIVDGFRAIGSSPGTLPLVALSALASFVYGTDTVVLVGAAEERLGLGPDGFGLLLAGLGIGGVLMAPLVDRLAASPRLSVVLLLGMAAYCIPNIALVVSESPAVAVAAQTVRGAGTLVVDVLAITAIQRTVPPHMVARVFGAFGTIVLGSIAIGTIVAPALSSAAGLVTALIVLAVAPLLLSLPALPALREVDRAGARRRVLLAPRIAVLERLGIFEAANRAVLERLAVAAAEQEVGAGIAVVTEGEQADALYVVLEGEVEVTAGGEAIRTMGPDSWFGEIGLLERIPRTATVTAVSPLQLLRIDGEAFVDALTTTPPTGMLLEHARARIARTHPQRDLTFEPAPAPT